MATIVKARQFDAAQGAWVEYGTLTVTPGAMTAGTGSLTSPVLALGSTDTQVANSAFQYTVNGLDAAKAAVAAGTALAAGTIPSNTWGIYLLSINAAGTIAVAAGALNFTTGYASEAAAIAALPATPANQASMGYVTVLTKVGSAFIGGTDSLKGGAAGNIASQTNYYNVLFTPEYQFSPDTASPVCQSGDLIFVQAPTALENNITLKGASVTGTNAVTVTLRNNSMTSVTGLIQTYSYKLVKFGTPS